MQTMNTREHFARLFAGERRKFENVIRALPTDKLSYKPHERNSSAGDIAWFLVLELRTLVNLATKFEHHWVQTPNPNSTEAIASAYEAAASDMEKALATLDDAAWEKDGRMYLNGKLMKSAPIGETIWDLFLDGVHHRGQLTAYLRPMGGKVPSTYGPTADSR